MAYPRSLLTTVAMQVSTFQSTPAQLALVLTPRCFRLTERERFSTPHLLIVSHDLTLNNTSIKWFQSTGAHYVFLDTTANSSSQNLSIYSKNIQGASGSTLLFELTHSTSSKQALVYTNSMTFEAEFDNLFFSSGEKPQYITWSSSQPFIIGTGGTGDFNTNYLKLQNTTVNVGTDTQRIDTKTHGFVTLNTPIAANASGNWFKLTGTAGGVENSTVLQAKQNSGSDTNIEYFGSTSWW